jgi:hypothetical protein
MTSRTWSINLSFGLGITASHPLALAEGPRPRLLRPRLAAGAGSDEILRLDFLHTFS